MRDPNGESTEYALYKGDDLLAIGTAGEIAGKLGVKRRTVLFYGTPSHKKRNLKNGRVLVRI